MKAGLVFTFSLWVYGNLLNVRERHVKVIDIAF